MANKRKAQHNQQGNAKKKARKEDRPDGKGGRKKPSGPKDKEKTPPREDTTVAEDNSGVVTGAPVTDLAPKGERPLGQRIAQLPAYELLDVVHMQRRKCTFRPDLLRRLADKGDAWLRKKAKKARRGKKRGGVPVAPVASKQDPGLVAEVAALRASNKGYQDMFATFEARLARMEAPVVASQEVAPQ